MKKLLAPLLVLTGLATGCAMGNAPVIPPAALIQTYKAPLDIDYQDTQLGAKQGTSTSKTVLGIVSWGDASTRAAAQQGGITTIRAADYEFYTVFGVYSTYTTIVYGD
jgi:hypothetical protein